MNRHTIENRWLRVRQVADYLNVSPATIWRWLETRDFPKPVKIGPRVTAWKFQDVLEWENGKALVQAATSEAAKVAATPVKAIQDADLPDFSHMQRTPKGAASCTA